MLSIDGPDIQYYIECTFEKEATGNTVWQRCHLCQPGNTVWQRWDNTETFPAEYLALRKIDKLIEEERSFEAKDPRAQYRINGFRVIQQVTNRFADVRNERYT
jgi:hypothetical protein